MPQYKIWITSELAESRWPSPPSRFAFALASKRDLNRLLRLKSADKLPDPVAVLFFLRSPLRQAIGHLGLPRRMKLAWVHPGISDELEESVLHGLFGSGWYDCITLHGWFPRTTVPLMVLSVNHLHAAKPTLATADAFGDMCSLRTVVIGPVIHL